MSEPKKHSKEREERGRVETKEDEQTVLKEWAKKIMKEAKRRERMMG